MSFGVQGIAVNMGFEWAGDEDTYYFLLYLGLHFVIFLQICIVSLFYGCHGLKVIQ